MTDAAFGAWFLSSAERANRVTKLDAGKASGVAWTEGNRVEPLVHGATYFSRLHHVLSRLGSLAAPFLPLRAAPFRPVSPGVIRARFPVPCYLAMTYRETTRTMTPPRTSANTIGRFAAGIFAVAVLALMRDFRSLT